MKKTVALMLILALFCPAVTPAEAESIPAFVPARPRATAQIPASTPIPTPMPTPVSTPAPTPAPVPTDLLPDFSQTADPDASMEAAPSRAPHVTPVPALPAPPPVPTVDNRIRRGDSGEEVRQVQERLRILGFMTGAADGHFGPLTEAAVVSLREYMQVLALMETTGQGLETHLPAGAVPARHTPAPTPQGDEETIVEVVDGEAPEESTSDEMTSDEMTSDENTPDAAEYSETDGMVDDTIRDLLLRNGFVIYREPLDRGSEGAEVTRLQNRLNTLNYLDGGVDGQFGKKTETALTAFQRENGLPQTGQADEETQLLLFSAGAKKAPVPSKPYVLKISVNDQRVYAYAYDISTGSYSRLVRTMVCSTGLPATPTPYGTFTSVGPVARWGYFPKWDVYAKYLFRITGGILFHSVLYQTAEESSLIQGSVSKLGSRASHGCVRLSVEDARWIYNNCPAGTTVIVY